MASIRARLYAPELVGTSDGVLSGKDFHYLVHVLRIGLQDRLVLFGLPGKESLCEVTEIGPDTVVVRLLQTRDSLTDSPVNLTLVVGVGKGKKLEEIVEATTPLGVRTLIPVVSERSIAKRSNPRLEERLESIALSACRQSGRATPPTLFPVQSDLQSVLKLPELSGFEGLLLDESGGPPILQALETLPSDAAIVLFCGPEGGWSASERGRLLASRCRSVSLGPRILRTELAAVVAVALVETAMAARAIPPSEGGRGAS